MIEFVLGLILGIFVMGFLFAGRGDKWKIYKSY